MLPGTLLASPEWLDNAPIAEGRALFPDEAVVEVYRSRRVSLDKRGRRTVLERKVYDIRDGSGQGCNAAWYWENVWRRVEALDGWRRNSSGKTEHLKKALSTQVLGGELFSDARQVGLVIPEVGPGTVVAFECRYSDEAPGLCLSDWPGRTKVPVVRWEYELRLPDQWEAAGFWVDPDVGSVPSPVVPDSIRTGLVMWVREGIAGPPEAEPLCPPIEALAPTFYVTIKCPEGVSGAIVDWDAVSDWHEDLQSGALAADEGLGDAAVDPDGAEPRSAAVTRRIATFVQSSIRYEQIYLDDGGWRPHAATEVYQNRFGDCKDMACLLVAMLRKAGVPAFPVVTNSAEWEPLRRDFPSPYAFNHCIVAIGPDDSTGLMAARSDQWLFFDPTAKSVAFGRLPASVEGKLALVVGASDEAALVRLPRATAAANQKIHRVSLQLSESLDCTGTVDVLLTGQAAFSFRQELAGSGTETLRRHYQAALSKQMPGGRVLQFEALGIDSPSESLRVAYEIELPAMGQRVDQTVFVAPLALIAPAEEIFTADHRRTDICLPYAYMSETTATVRLPAGWGLSDVPEDASVVNAFGMYQRSCEPTEDGFQVVRVEAVEHTQFPAIQYAFAREWDRTRYDADRQMVVISTR